MNGWAGGVPVRVCTRFITTTMSENDDVVKATSEGAHSTTCDPTPEQLEFLLSKISGSYEDAVKRAQEIRKE